MNKTKKQRGFTLIELLVVIAIIGILTTLVTANLTQAQSRARDARRKSDLKVIAQGLEMYYSQNSQYPDIGTAAGAFHFGSATSPSSLGDPTTTDVYIKSIPRDPRNVVTQSEYYYCTEAVTAPARRRMFNLYARLENANDAERYCGVPGASVTWDTSGVTCDTDTSGTTRPTSRCGIGSASTSGTTTAIGTVKTNSNYTVSEP